MDKIAFVIPTYPPDYHYLYDLLIKMNTIISFIYLHIEEIMKPSFRIKLLWKIVGGPIGPTTISATTILYSPLY